MVNKNFMADDLLSDTISDKFDLPLYEDSVADYYTTEELKQEVSKRIAELIKLGYKFSPTQIVDYVLMEGSSSTAATQSVAANQYRFKIANSAARKRNEKYLDNIIYHELCHMLQLDYLFDNNLIFYIDGKLKRNPNYRERVDAWLKADSGHTALWYFFVHKVNSALAVNPPIDRTLSDKDLTDIFLESTFSSEYEDLDFDGFYDYFPEVMKED